MTFTSKSKRRSGFAKSCARSRDCGKTEMSDRMTNRNDKTKYEGIIERLDDKLENVWFHMVSFKPSKPNEHDIQAMIIEFLKQNPSASASEMAALMGLDTKIIDMAIRRLVRWKSIEISTTKKVRYFRLRKETMR